MITVVSRNPSCFAWLRRRMACSVSGNITLKHLGPVAVWAFPLSINNILCSVPRLPFQVIYHARPSHPCPDSLPSEISFRWKIRQGRHPQQVYIPMYCLKHLNRVTSVPNLASLQVGPARYYPSTVQKYRRDFDSVRATINCTLSLSTMTGTLTVTPSTLPTTGTLIVMPQEGNCTLTRCRTVSDLTGLPSGEQPYQAVVIGWWPLGRGTSGTPIGWIPPTGDATEIPTMTDLCGIPGSHGNTTGNGRNALKTNGLGAILSGPSTSTETESSTSKLWTASGSHLPLMADTERTGPMCTSQLVSFGGFERENYRFELVTVPIVISTPGLNFGRIIRIDTTCFILWQRHL